MRPGELFIAQINIQSMKPKLPELRLLAHQYDAIAISESWLSPDVPQRLLNIDGYQLFRRDRPATSRLPRRRGGVAVLVRDSLHVRVIDVPSAAESSNLEIIWTSISCASHRCLILGSFYRHPTNTVSQITADLDDLERQIQFVFSRYPGLTVLAGDHNLNQLDRSACAPGLRLADLLANYEFRQCNTTVPTYTPALSLLDTIAVNRDNCVRRSGVTFCHYSPHRWSRAIISVSKVRPKSTVVMSRCLNKFDFVNFNSCLYQCDWSAVFTVRQTSQKWHNFTSIFTSMLDAAAPERRIRVRNPAAPPVSEQTRLLMAARREALTGGDRARYKQLNRETSAAIRRDCRDDVHRRINQSSRSSIWRCLRPIIGGGRSSVITVPGVQPDTLNRYFVGVGPTTAASVPPPSRNVPMLLPRVMTCCFRVCPVTLESLRYTLANMKASKSCGTDGISVDMFQKCFHGIGHVLLDVVNSSLTSASVPLPWKHALVTPLPKTSDVSDPSKFRPISVVPGIAKVVERIVHHQLCTYFEKHQLFSNAQHGYRRYHSTETALTVLSDHILSGMDNSEITILVLADLSKCFDVVSHQALLTKLRMYNIDTRWFESYLSDHSQQVQMNDGSGRLIRSEPLPNTVGVYQGTALGPIMFSIFSNDLAMHVPDAGIVQYADDVQIWKTGKKQNIVDLISSMEGTLAVVSDWFCSNSMKVNVSKTQLIVFGTRNMLRDLPPVQLKFGNSVITESRVVKNLGLTMDRHLTFESHIDQLVAKCTGVLIALSHSKHVLPSFTVALVVNALVISAIRYCIAIYGTCGRTQLNRIQKLLNFCARVISGRRKYDHISDVLRGLKWLRAEQLVEYHQLCLVKTVIDSNLPPDIAAMFSHVSTAYCTRQTGHLYCPRAKSSSGVRRLAHCSTAFNRLPTDLKSLRMGAFKRRLKHLLLLEAG